MFVIVAFIIFAGCFGGVAYYVWAIPQQEEERILASRLRDLRGNVRSRTRSSPDLLRREEQGVFAALGKLFEWVAPLRRLQVYIQQANLKYRSQDVMVACIGVALLVYLIEEVAGVNILLLKLLVAGLMGYLPIFLIVR